jgi:hypothetical protein
MSSKTATPFDNIESAHEYVRLLVEALEEADQSIKEDAAIARQAHSLERRAQALHLVEYKLNQLREHFQASRRILNDLRTLLLGERGETASDQSG